MTYYRVTFDRKYLEHWIPVRVAIVLDGNNEGPNRICQVLEGWDFSSLNILGSDPSLPNLFSAYRLSAAADTPSHGYKKSGHIELVWQR
jgi:hypothetical protein